MAAPRYAQILLRDGRMPSSDFFPAEWLPNLSTKKMLEAVLSRIKDSFEQSRCRDRPANEAFSVVWEALSRGPFHVARVAPKDVELSEIEATLDEILGLKPTLGRVGEGSESAESLLPTISKKSSRRLTAGQRDGLRRSDLPFCL